MATWRRLLSEVFALRGGLVKEVLLWSLVIFLVVVGTGMLVYIAEQCG